MRTRPTAAVTLAAFLLTILLISGCSSGMIQAPFGSGPEATHADGVPPPANAGDPSLSATDEPPADAVALGSDPDTPADRAEEIAAAEAAPETAADKPAAESAKGTASDAESATEKKFQTILDESLNYCEVSQQFWQKGDLENALEALDQAYSLILSADIADRPKLTRQKDDLRFLISKRILEIYASRNIVVNGNHNAIPMTKNKYVQAEIDNFTTGGERDFFIQSFKRSGRYRPQIVAALEAAGLPSELSWLPLIESGFKVRALSHARALGLWQFIPSTGYKFGLSRDRYIDERLDPEKSTVAAIAYLKELHQIFGDWATVLAAYNCGEGRVLRVIREQKVNYLDNFWDLYERLPYETARYVPRFLATLHIVANLEKYGLDAVPLDPPFEYDELEIEKQTHLQHIARAIGSDEDHLVELNPELRYKILPPTRYALKLPPDTHWLLATQLGTIPETKLPSQTFVYHRVRRGETLSTIARKYRTRVRSIMQANNLRSSHYIVAGRLLKIPQHGFAQSKPAPTSAGPLSRTTHRVGRGDNLWNIAQRYGTTTLELQEINNLETTDLTIGQVLKLPGRQGMSSAGGEAYKVYEVKSGDSPFTIAQQHKMALSRFLRINQLSARSKIFPGQELFVE
jgi:membrane-bound lytic murein transglycosylase D